MVIIAAAINNPAPSHTTSSLGAVEVLARATGGTLFLRINFTCASKNCKGPALAGPAPELHSPHPEHRLRGLWRAVQVSVVALGHVCRCSAAIRDRPGCR
jgi:hypothetical protein